MFGYIYLTENIFSGKRYIGQKRGSFNPKYFGSGIALKNAIRIYGKENFIVSVIDDTAKNRHELNELERHYISRYNAVNSDKFYNIATGGNAWGSPHSAETRMKISQAASGRTSRSKGIPNPNASLRMKEHNPMHNPNVARKVAEKLKGRPSNRRLPLIDLACEECHHTFSVKRKERNRKYCGKSCAAKVRNRTQWSDPIYKKRVGKAISTARCAK